MHTCTHTHTPTSIIYVSLTSAPLCCHLYLSGQSSLLLETDAAHCNVDDITFCYVYFWLHSLHIVHEIAQLYKHFIVCAAISCTHTLCRWSLIKLQLYSNAALVLNCSCGWQ
jgi:hypothetical protein